MSRKFAALALVVVLVASVLGGYGAVSNSRAGDSPTPATSVTAFTAPPSPAASSIAIGTFDGEGIATTSFCTGSCLTFNGGGAVSGNQLTFGVSDTSADLRVNVTVNDPNATRDGLVDPVFTATLGIDPTSHENLSQVNNHLSYTFPSSLVYGGGWNITASGPLGGFTSVPLTVHTYSFALESAPAANAVTIPGESLDLSWVVSASANGALYSKFTALFITGTYVNGTPHNLFSPGLYSLPLTAAGSTTVQVPGNATPGSQVLIAAWAVTNVSGGISENESATTSFWVGSPVVFEALASTSSGCVVAGPSDTTFSSGSPVFACAWVGAEVTGHSSEFVPGLLVNITFWDGAQTVVPGGAPPATLTTTGTSPVAFSFIPTAPPFSSYYAYPFGNSFNLTATDPAATTLGYPGAYENYSFEVIPSGASGAVQVTLNAFDYAVGATVSATWTLGSSNASETGALTATQWALVTSRGFAATGPIASTSSSGVLSIPLPAGYVGEFAVAVVASNGSGAFIGAGTGEAEQPSLLLGSPLGGWYVPGQALSFPVEIAPNALPDTTIYYNVTGEWYSFALGTVVSEGIVAVGTVGSSGAVQFTVATESPATYYFVDVWAQSPTSGVYASASAEVRLATGFQVLLGVTTASSYSDGSFQPGQSIQVSWALSSLGGVPLPGAYMIVLELASTTVLTSWSTTASSGAVSVTIPSNAPSGVTVFEMYVYASNLYGPDCAAGAFCFAETGVTVNAHPSILSLELGAGSGLTVGWLVLLIVILVVAVLLVLLVRRGRTPRSPLTLAAPTTEEMPPPAPAPSTSPATEWSGPKPTPTWREGDSPPPLPTPTPETE